MLNSQIRRLCARTAMIGENGASPLMYLVSMLQSMLVFDIWRTYPPPDQLAIDPSRIDSFKLLSMAKYYIFEMGDFDAAVRYIFNRCLR